MSLTEISRYISLILRHLSKDKETAIKVGQRHGRPVLYTVKSREMHGDGYKFYLSRNGVWLTREVPVKYLKKENN